MLSDANQYGQSKILYERARAVIPSGVNSPVRFYAPFPFFATSAKDSKIVTVDHKTYIDYCMGYGALLLGHAYTPVINHVKYQIDNGSLFCVPTENEVELAELFSEILPFAEMTRTVNTGAEATMNAIRLARAFTKKKNIIKFEGCYHGSYDYVLVNAGQAHRGISSSEGNIEEAASHTLVLPYNNFAELEQVISTSDNIAAIIIEPVLANSGLILPGKEYLNNIRNISRKENIVLIFDEVITGFRLSLGGASEFFGIKPDIATYAKAMGNGFPIAAIAGRRDIMEQFAPMGKLYQASTFAGNPTSVAAGISTIRTLIEQKNTIYPKIAKICDSIVGGIRDTMNTYSLDFILTSIGSMFHLSFIQGEILDASLMRKANLGYFRLMYNELLKSGVFIPPSQFETCFVSYSHNEEDIDQTIESYSKALQKVKEHL
ncbi:MAG TPA: glutamate-1-semialdehyde 2,1-aminomutase [Nitrososphaeraceae archaeon]|nr:glutamate-1-semialdehyde 2,1-aminomutase [Nitrososphaeraceae archaeon]